MILTGAEILIECLKEQGVDIIFGFPGGSVLNIYDALYNAKNDIKHILTSHEQGASHAADGYARATGKVGVCLVTSGPGATNLVTGIATAYMDSTPIIAITGQVPTNLLGKDSFQEVDITGITMPITKNNYIVKDVTKLADIIREAFYIAKEGRPGPVLIDICKDVTSNKTEYKNSSNKISNLVDSKISSNKINSIKINSVEINNVAEIINNSKKPIILSGGGVSISSANEEVFELAKKCQIPVTTTLMGLGSFPGTDEFFTGMIGMHGTKTSNLAISEADLLIAIGTRFSDRVISNIKKFAPNAKIIHIDIDPAEIGKNVTVHYPLLGNIKLILKNIIKLVKPKSDSEWLTQIMKWKEMYPLKYINDQKLRPNYILERIYELTKGNAIITTEVGQNQLWAAQIYKYSFPRQFISSGGLGTMGFGLGASIGAKLGMPNKKVINIAGDGSFRMNCIELATAVRYKIPVIIALLNNQVLGMVRQWQQLFYEGRYSETILGNDINYVALAEAFGAIGINVRTIEEVDQAIEKALLSKDKPVLINFEIEEDNNVFPIVPPGAGINELIES